MVIDKKSKEWVNAHIAGIFIFNLSIFLLMLLRSAGYFHPFFELSVNRVMLLSIFFAIIFLRITNRTLFILALVFWISALFFKVVGVDIWAERMGIYTYEAFSFALLLLMIESITISSNGKIKNSK